MSENESLICVFDIMSSQPITIQASKSVSDVAKLMKKYRISSVVVLDKKDVVGIITVDDIVRKAVAAGQSPTKITAQHIMTPHVISVHPRADVREAMDLFAENEVRQVPVMDDGVLVGFLTQKDVLRIEPTLVDLALDKIKQKEEDRQARIQRFADQEFLDDEDEEHLL
jgi:CBS domain-containing protein